VTEKIKPELTYSLYTARFTIHARVKTTEGRFCLRTNGGIESLADLQNAVTLIGIDGSQDLDKAGEDAAKSIRIKGFHQCKKAVFVVQPVYRTQRFSVLLLKLPGNVMASTLNIICDTGIMLSFVPDIRYARSSPVCGVSRDLVLQQGGWE